MEDLALVPESPVVAKLAAIALKSFVFHFPVTCGSPEAAVPKNSGELAEGPQKDVQAFKEHVTLGEVATRKENDFRTGAPRVLRG